jgi:hypothetical protein
MIFSHVSVSSILVIALILEIIILIDASLASKGPEEYLLAENSDNVCVTDRFNRNLQKFSSDGNLS